MLLTANLSVVVQKSDAQIIIIIYKTVRGRRIYTGADVVVIVREDN